MVCFDLFADNIFENIANNRKLLKNNGEYDIDRAKYLLLKEFKEGKLGRITLEKI